MMKNMATHPKMSSVKNKKALSRDEEISKALCNFLKITIQTLGVDVYENS